MEHYVPVMLTEFVELGKAWAVSSHGMENISTVLKAWLAIRGWEQKDLAKESGVSASRISIILTGKEEPRAQTIKRFARAIGVTLEEFWHPPEGGPAQPQKPLEIDPWFDNPNATWRGLPIPKDIKEKLRRDLSEELKRRIEGGK